MRFKSNLGYLHDSVIAQTLRRVQDNLEAEELPIDRAHRGFRHRFTLDYTIQVLDAIEEAENEHLNFHNRDQFVARSRMYRWSQQFLNGCFALRILELTELQLQRVRAHFADVDLDNFLRNASRYDRSELVDIWQWIINRDINTWSKWQVKILSEMQLMTYESG